MEVHVKSDDVPTIIQLIAGPERQRACLQRLHRFRTKILTLQEKREHLQTLKSSDDRKKANLLVVLRRYASEGLQPVFTLIDSDLPNKSPAGEAIFFVEEIALTLHDEGQSERLFKMPSW